MENIVIITLTSVLAILFIGFGWMTLKEFKKIIIEEWLHRFPDARANMVKFVASLFDEKYTKLPIKERVLFYKQVKRFIADMESDGVYFPEEVKTQLEAKRQSLVTAAFTGFDATTLIQRKFDEAMKEELSKPENQEFLKKCNEDGSKKNENS